jgi:hypothetical protein
MGIAGMTHGQINLGESFWFPEEIKFKRVLWGFIFSSTSRTVTGRKPGRTTTTALPNLGRAHGCPPPAPQSHRLVGGSVPQRVLSFLKIPKRVLHIQEVFGLSAEKMKTRKKSVRNYLGDVHPPFEGKKPS